MSPARLLLTVYKAILIGVGFIAGVDYMAFMKALHNGESRMAMFYAILLITVLWAGWYMTRQLEGQEQDE